MFFSSFRACEVRGGIEGGEGVNAGIDPWLMLRHICCCVVQSASASVEKCMCQALMRITAGLYLAGLLNPRPTPFNTEEQYYEQRFFIFTQLAAPAPLSYEDYATAMSLSGTVKPLQAETFVVQAVSLLQSSCTKFPLSGLSE